MLWPLATTAPGHTGSHGRQGRPPRRRQRGEAGPLYLEPAERAPQTGSPMSRVLRPLTAPARSGSFASSRHDCVGRPPSLPPIDLSRSRLRPLGGTARRRTHRRTRACCPQRPTSSCATHASPRMPPPRSALLFPGGCQLKVEGDVPPTVHVYLRAHTHGRISLKPRRPQFRVASRSAAATAATGHRWR